MKKGKALGPLCECEKRAIIDGHPKGSRNNNFPEFEHKFGADWVDLREQNRRRSKTYAEDFASEDRPKMA